MALSELMSNREALYEDIRVVKHELTDCTGLEGQLQEVVSEMEVIAGLIRKCIEDNAAKGQDQTEYEKQYLELTEQYEKLSAKQAALKKERQERKCKADMLGGFLFEIGELPELNMVFSETRLRAMVDRVTVFTDGKLVFRFKNGSEVTVAL